MALFLKKCMTFDARTQICSMENHSFYEQPENSIRKTKNSKYMYVPNEDLSTVMFTL